MRGVVCMNSRRIMFLLMVTLLLPAGAAYGQGCIVSRSSTSATGPDRGGYLDAGDWDVTVGYRHQFSYKHFVGDVEQVNRVQQGNQVMNKLNLSSVLLTYQATDRLSVGLTVPILFASRRSNNAYSTTHASGLGDVSLVGQFWLWNPKHARRANISLGLGVQAPSGKDDVRNNTLSAPGATPALTLVDYSIQPGSGGWGAILQWQSFKALGRSVVYFNGNYLATQGGNNGVQRSTTGNPLTQYVAIQDQYLMQAGVAHPVSKIPGLTITFGPRWEGVPAKNLWGDNLGFRRPGYAVSAEPGFVYARGRNMIQASVGKAILRDRTRSVPDRMTGGHGDAAFADYVWLVSYSLRIPKGGGREH
jgi:hypothetical protein